MGCSRRYLISRFLLARPRTKCLSLALFSIALYVVGSFMNLNGHALNVLGYSPGISEGDATLQDFYENSRTAKEPVLDEQGLEGDTGQNNVDNEGQDTPDVVIKNIEITNIQSNHSRSLRRPRRKFVFVFRYYEQLGRATSNLIALASFAKHKNRFLVVPYVNNSRMSGLPIGVSHHFRKSDFLLQKPYAPLSEYFDLKDMNEKLKSHGYSTLEEFRDFESQCAKRLNIVVHFLFDNESTKKDMSSWYRLSYGDVTALYKRAKEQGGWIDCPVVKHSRLHKQVGFKISRYVCVDPEIIRTPWEFEEKVLQAADCVGIVQWKGIGQERAHFSEDSTITQPLYPSDFEFSPHLTQIARNFVRNKFDGEFIAVHVRSERHITRKGYNVTKRCMQKLANRIQEYQNSYRVKGVFLASDLTEYGSDTLMEYAEKNDRRSLSLFLHKALNYPTTFEPKGGLYDTGAVAIIEMNILSLATRLFTMGSGNFQDWALSLFLKRHGNEQRRVHRMCEDA